MDRLLILDDDPQFTDYAGTVAKAAGYEVLAITDPTKFEDTLASWPPSHVIIDLNMPDIDGLEALQILARGRSAAKVMLCSAAGRDFLEAVDRLGKRLKLNMCAIIEKPVGVTELNAILEGFREGSARPPSSSHERFDRSLFDEVYKTMGREWVNQGLTSLITQCEQTFVEQQAASADRKQLARSAHAIVSYAGILGFSELSRLCHELEDACNSGGDVSTRLHEVQEAARMACGKAREIAAGLRD